MDQRARGSGMTLVNGSKFMRTNKITAQETVSFSPVLLLGDKWHRFPLFKIKK